MTVLHHPDVRIRELEAEVEKCQSDRNIIWKDYTDSVRTVGKLRAWLILVTDNYLDDYPAMAKLIHGVLAEEQ